MPVRVFLSYSHDSESHRAQVLTLADRLRADGIDARLDQYEGVPPEGWPRWMLQQIEHADFVLMVCTETYRRRFEGTEAPGQGLGVAWEGLVAQQLLYDERAQNRKFIPVLLGTEPATSIPRVLRAWNSYRMPKDYDELLRRLRGEPAVSMPPLGEHRSSRPVSTSQTSQAEGENPASPMRPDRRVVDTFADLYPSPQQARAVWQRAGGRVGDVSHTERPRDMWWDLWRQSLLGSPARPESLLREALQDAPENPTLRAALSNLTGTRMDD